MIEQARNFILKEVDNPALNHPDLNQKIKNKVQNSKNIVNKMKKTGDLYKYLKRFHNTPSPGEDEVYDTMKKLGLNTYEDILPVFCQKFKHDFDNTTVLNDFIIGKIFSSWDIAIFAKTYNVQSGIYLIPGYPNYQAIFIKATLDGGKYPNSWLIPEVELKYYLYSLKEKFDPNYKVNQAILNSNTTKTPIYVFIKNKLELTLTGIFQCIEMVSESDGSKWFRLKKVNIYETTNPMTDEEYHKEIYKNIKEAQKLTSNERKELLKLVNKKPETVQIITTGFKRDPNVVAEVLEQANGICNYCKNEAPFLRATDGTPYLEVHHVIPLAKGGDDTVENAVALCPNCHRKAHFG